MTLTLAEVKAAALPAVWRGEIGVRLFTAQYMPENPEASRVCIRAPGWGGMTLGPGGSAVADGWMHAHGCRCPYAPDCTEVAR